MSLQAILFDMDGTLVPMDQEVFVKCYFGELAKVLAPFGVEPKRLVTALWEGVDAMVRNDGIRRNIEVFWERFGNVYGEISQEACERISLFYAQEFHNARVSTGANPLAAEAVRLAHGGGRKVVLATNPIFPMTGQESRMSWVGLCPENFDLVTSYETDSFCKPNPQYFLSLCDRIGVRPQDCLMIGNDEHEDMYAAAEAGMQCYLVTDCAIPCREQPWTGARGTFAELTELLRGLQSSE